MAQKQVPLHKQLVNFTSSTIGLEKTLRLIQASALVASQVCTDVEIASKCSIAVSQLALGRRYFRLLDFIGCFENAQNVVAGDFSTRGTIISLLEIAESTFLGIYLLLENLTILHDMGIWLVSWYTPLLIEANKFWVYAIALSFFRAGLELSFTPTANAKQPKSSTKEKSETPPEPVTVSSKIPVLKRVIVDGCDLLLPGTFIGWTPASDLSVGITMIISTIVGSQDLWVKAQQ